MRRRSYILYSALTFIVMEERISLTAMDQFELLSDIGTDIRYARPFYS